MEITFTLCKIIDIVVVVSFNSSEFKPMVMLS